MILLAGCLTFHGPPDPITRRLAEPAAQGQWDAILAAGLSRGLLAAVIGRLPAGAMIDADATALGTAAHTPPFILAQHLAAVRYRRRSQRTCLTELVTKLNERGIEPLLIGNASSLWLDAPAWLYARALPIAVSASELPKAQTALLGGGYRQVRALQPLRYAGETHWFKPELAGWIELYGRGANRRIEAALPKDEILQASIQASLGAASARVLRPDFSVLHMLCHEELADWDPGATGRLCMKSLYEFAAALSHLSSGERQNLITRVRQSKQLSRAFELWLAAADDCFRLLPLEPLTLQPAAVRDWRIRKAVFEDDRSRLGRKLAVLGARLRPAAPSAGRVGGRKIREPDSTP